MSSTNKWSARITVVSTRELNTLLHSAIVWQVRDWDRRNIVTPPSRDPKSVPGKIVNVVTLTSRLKPNRYLLEAVRHLIAGSGPKAGEVVITEITLRGPGKQRK